ncbi:MAG TPA: cytochrome ubiquinol oxidase subunit I, partial [Syntrophales bacterium]|nr:cytochrome ubiquinol oxidase subunit I [Syntrophales bacterium]
VMVGLGIAMILVCLLAVWFSRKEDIAGRTWLLKLALLSLPLPYVAGLLGWVVAEVGRQPWIVYGVLKTADAVSKSVSTAQVAGSLAGFTLLYGGLAVVDVWLLARYARRGPA